MNIHFLSLLEALLDCRSVMLCKLIPMWKEVLFIDKNIKVTSTKIFIKYQNVNMANVIFIYYLT